MSNEKKILVIENEGLTRRNLVQFLESEEFEVREAKNGQLGVQIAQAYFPDLIICDILMPELDGYDVLTQLQQNPQTAAIPFIFLTTASARDSSSLVDMGTDAYLSKPVTFDQLRSVIAKHLQPSTVSSQSSPEAIPEVTLSQIERYLQLQENLIAQFLLALQNSLLMSNNMIREIQAATTAEIRDRELIRLKQQFSYLLSLVNQFAELQDLLTLENVERFEQFPFSSFNNQDTE